MHGGLTEPLTIYTHVHHIHQHGCNALYYLFAAASARCLSDADVEQLVQRLIAKGIDVNCHFWGQVRIRMCV